MRKLWILILLRTGNMIKCLRCVKQSSQLQNYWHFGLGNCLLHRALLCLAVSLTSTHQISVTHQISITHSPTSCDSRKVSRHCQASPEGKYCPQLRTTGLDVLFGLEFIENSLTGIWIQFRCSSWPLRVYRKGNALNTV